MIRARNQSSSIQDWRNAQFVFINVVCRFPFGFFIGGPTLCLPGENSATRRPNGGTDPERIGTQRDPLDMANLDINHPSDSLNSARQHARQAGYLQHAQMMLVAAGIAAASIVAVAATMMTTLL